MALPIIASVFNTTNQLLEISDKGQFFNAADMTLLTDVAEIMIPKTGTPGATDAFVIPVLDAMMLTWAGKETKKQFRNIIEQINLFAKEMHKQQYVYLDHDKRRALIVELDSTAFKYPDTNLSTSYRKLKKMIFHLYYTSEEANPDFVLIPGGYKGDLTKNELLKIQQRGYL